ncbi:DNA polymerase III subunit delta [bacterium]|nr:DNA polymerase III subunit delta [bacterium]
MSSGKHQKNLNNVTGDISQGTIKPVYLLTGTEDYLVFHARKAVLTALKKTKNIETEEFVDSEKTSPQELIYKLNSPSLFNPFQIIVVRDAPWFDTRRIAEAEPFKKWLLSATTTSTLVLTSSTVDKRLGIVRQIKKHGELLSFEKIKSYDQGNIRKDVYYPFVQDKLFSARQMFEADAWQLLRQLTLDTMWDVMNAVDVVSAYAGEQQRITIADVSACIQDHSEMPGYMVLEAMSGRNPLKIQSCLKKSLSSGMHGLLLNKIIGNRVRALLVTHSLKLNQLRIPTSYPSFMNALLPKMMPAIESDPVGMKILVGMKPYALYMLLKQCCQFNTKELADCLVRLEKIDSALKSGSSYAQELLETALLPFCRNRRS